LYIIPYDLLARIITAGSRGFKVIMIDVSLRNATVRYGAGTYRGVNSYKGCYKLGLVHSVAYCNPV